MFFSHLIVINSYKQQLPLIFFQCISILFFFDLLYRSNCALIPFQFDHDSRFVRMLPRKKHSDKPAVVIELKWDKSAVGAIEQIKEKQYGNALKEYQGNLLLVGINYNKMTKKHECVIETMQK